MNQVQCSALDAAGCPPIDVFSRFALEWIGRLSFILHTFFVYFVKL